MPRLAGRRRAALGTFGAAALLVAAACNGDGEAAEDNTTTERSTTSSTEREDPFAVPDEIVEPYVQRVLDELYSIQGDALRLTVERGVVDEDVLELLERIYNEEEVRFAANSFSDAAIRGFENLIIPPGDTEARVEMLVSASSDCIFVHTTQDASRVSSDAAPPSAVYVELAPAERNETHWVIEAASTEGPDGNAPEDSCASS